MTICSTMLAAIDKRLAQKKTLEEIGCELCDAVEDPKGKAVRIIKAHRGEKFLRDNADWLGYDVNKASSGKNGGKNCQKEFARKNLSTSEDSTDEEQEETDPIKDTSNNIKNILTKMSSMDNFDDDEIVYESNTDSQEETKNLCCSYNPTTPEEQPKACPCGCGYGYYEKTKTWSKIE